MDIATSQTGKRPAEIVIGDFVYRDSDGWVQVIGVATMGGTTRVLTQGRDDALDFTEPDTLVDVCLPLHVAGT